MLKELNSGDFAAPILNDLGMIKPTPTAKRVMRFVELECVECATPFRISVDNAKRRKESRCSICKASPSQDKYRAKILSYDVPTSSVTCECRTCSASFTQTYAKGLNNAYGVCADCRTATDTMVNSSGEFNIEAINKVIVYDSIKGTLYNKVRERYYTIAEDGRLSINNSIMLKATRLIYLIEYGVEIPDSVWFTYKDNDMTNITLDNIGFTLKKPTVVYEPRDVITYEKFKENIIAANVTIREEAKVVSGYSSMSRKGLAIKAFEELGIEKSIIDWTPKLAASRALMYPTRIEFKRNDPKAYDYTIKYSGCPDEIMAHMVPSSNSDNNAIYIWKVVGLDDVYKIGVTSTRLGCERIQHVAGKAGVEYDIVILASVVSKATEIEKMLLDSSTPYSFDYKFDGSTEFRKIANDEIDTMINIIKSKEV